MTDREFEKWFKEEFGDAYVYGDSYVYTEGMELAWQARGELAAVRIAELSLQNQVLREALKDLIKENIENREYNSKKSIYNITVENKAINLLEELDK